MRRFLLLLSSNVFGIIEILLLVRVILKALSASASAIIVGLIYRVTDFLLIPIEGIFSNISFSLGVIDLVAITGMIAYLILFLLIFKIFSSIS